MSKIADSFGYANGHLRRVRPKGIVLHRLSGDLIEVEIKEEEVQRME